jgi:hypothetical protein
MGRTYQTKHEYVTVRYPLFVAKPLWITVSLSPSFFHKETFAMADLISTLANKSGISIEQAKKGMGTLLAFFKANLPAETFSKVTSAVPGAEGMMAAAPEAQESAGGILGTVKDMAGKILGGSVGGAGAVLSKLTQFGFSAEQLQKFVPNVLAFLKSKLPGDVMKQVSALVPTGEAAAS